MNLEKALEVFNFKDKSEVKESGLRLTYIGLAKSRHPDVSGDSESFIELRQAYEFLLAYVKRLKELQKSPRSEGLYTEYMASEGLLDKSVLITKASFDKHHELLKFVQSEVDKSVRALEITKMTIDAQMSKENDALYKKYFDNFWVKLVGSNLGVSTSEYAREKLLLDIKYQEIKNQQDKKTYQQIINQYSSVLDDITNNLEVVKVVPIANK